MKEGSFPLPTIKRAISMLPRLEDLSKRAAVSLKKGSGRRRGDCSDLDLRPFVSQH